MALDEQGVPPPEAAAPEAAEPEVRQPEPSGGGVSSPGEAPSPGQSPPLTVRGLMDNLGYALPEGVSDDYTALVHLAQQATEAQELRRRQQESDLYGQLGRQLAPKAREIGQFLQQQQAPAGRRDWEPPPYDERWEQLVQQDPKTGMYVGRNPAVPAAIVDAANEYASYMQRFFRDPMGVFRAYSEDREKGIEERVTQAVTRAMEGDRRDRAVQAIVAENARWFYARDAEGRPIADPVRGGYRPTQLGLQYLEAVRWAAEAGVADPVLRDAMARGMLRPEIAAATAPAPATQVAESEASRRQARAAARPRQNPLQGMTREERGRVPHATEPEPRTLSLAEMMREQFHQEGITEEDMKAPGAFGA